MFNFDTTFTKGKHNFKIVDNEVVEGQDNLSAVNCNALIDHWLNSVIEPQVNKATPSKDFDTLVKEVSYLRSAIDRVIYLKKLNCSYGNKTLEELEIKAESVNTNFYNKIKNLSNPQKLVIGSKADRHVSFESYLIQEYYDAVKNDDSKLQEWWKELNDFDYEKYGESKNNLLEKSNSHSSYQRTLERIEHFLVILKEAGDDIVNWSDQKISLRFTKLGINEKAYSVKDYVDAYSKHLLKNGVSKEKKVKTSKDKLEDIIKKGNATQEEYFRYYKQASKYDASSVLKKLDLDYLLQLIESDLKCVKEKLIGDRSWKKFSSDGETVLQFLCEKSKTKEDYKRIIAWATPENVTLDFMVKHKDHANQQEVIEFSKTRTIPNASLVDEDFYQTCLVKIKPSQRYSLSEGLTYQYLARMNEQEKIDFLNYIKEEYQINYSELFNLYKNVSYNPIKGTIFSNVKLLNHLSLKLVKEQDHKALVEAAIKACGNLEKFQKEQIFNTITFEEKKQVIKEVSKQEAHYTDYYTGAVKKLSDSENLELLKELFEITSASNYITKIFKHFKDKKKMMAIQEANKIVFELESPDSVPLNEEVISCLTVDTKVELLNKGINLLDSKSYSGYANYRHITSISLGNVFFNDFKREDILKVCDEKDLIHYRHIKFLAHVLTKDELEKCGTREISFWNRDTQQSVLEESFFRYNIELFSYGFLKQFKEKEPFKLVVGDRRNSSNRYFGEKLLKKLNVSNSIDFMFS